MAERWPALVSMRTHFREKADNYQKVAHRWRNRNFGVAVLMGILPVMAGGSTLLPEWMRAWSTLVLSVVNVFVVVVNVKLDMGERIADAARASKGFNKMAVDLGVFLSQEDCEPGVQCHREVFSTLKVVLRFVEESVEFPLQSQDQSDSTDVKSLSKLAKMKSNISDVSSFLTPSSKVHCMERAVPPHQPDQLDFQADSRAAKSAPQAESLTSSSSGSSSRVPSSVDERSVSSSSSDRSVEESSAKKLGVPEASSTTQQAAPQPSPSQSGTRRKHSKEHAQGFDSTRGAAQAEPPIPPKPMVIDPVQPNGDPPVELRYHSTPSDALGP